MAVLKSVAKTDTFEILRQKINQVALDVFNIESGNTNLLTNQLKIGDGNISEPSLAFDSEIALGFYKPSLKTIGIASDNKKIVNFSEFNTTLFKDLNIQKSIINNSSLFIANGGKNYDVGTFNNINLIGGSGSGAAINITVTSYVGEISDGGSGYIDGEYSNIYLQGGSGTEALVSILIEDGIVDSITFISKGNDYEKDDILTLPEQVTNVSTTLDSESNVITVSSPIVVYPGFAVVQTSGSGVLGTNIFVESVDENTITLSEAPEVSGSAVLSFIPPYGNPTSEFSYQITEVGVVNNIVLSQAGSGYSINDILTVNNLDLILPITYSVVNKDLQRITFSTQIAENTFSVGDEIEIEDNLQEVIHSSEIYDITISGGFIQSVLIDYSSEVSLSSIFKFNQQSYSIQSVSGIIHKFFIDSGDGLEYSPSLTLIPGNTYIFDLSDDSNLSHTFTLSDSPGGEPYTNNVVISGNLIILKVTEITPNLYYFCTVEGVEHDEEGSTESEFSLLIVDQDNPKILGSDFSVEIADIQIQNTIVGDVETGQLTAISFSGNQSNVVNATVSGTLTAPSIVGNAITASSISSSGTLQISGAPVTVASNFNIGSTVQMVSATGNITTSGVLRTNGSFTASGLLTITNSTISTPSTNDIILNPGTGRIARVTANTALIIPSGNTLQRPSGGLAQNGAIRFNTDTSQYEGYSIGTNSWSSLGGVRDLDGNTFVAAEAFTGANDNILYFVNDGNNTLKLSTSYLDFNTTKKIRSLNPNLPTYREWTALTSVEAGEYIKYRNNIYLATNSGTTAAVTNEPTHTIGTVVNGTVQLEWVLSAVSPLIFEEIQELQVGPLGNLPLVVNNQLRLSNNVISTELEDLIVRPSSGKKIVIDATTSLVIPTGSNNNRGLAERGSIRYNTSIAQFEGYDGANWTSLGGVKDVDGNTFILPELSPGSNENVIYFVNDGNTTLELSTSSLRFVSISRITSASNTLQLDADLVSFNNLSTSIESLEFSSFLSSTKDNFDFGLSVGLFNDYLLRLNTSGNIIVNRGFGTGTPDNITLLTSNLKDFELTDLKVSTSDITLVKNTTDVSTTILYSPAFASGAKVLVNVYIPSTNKVEMIEYNVIDKNSDIFYSDYGNITTDEQLVTVSFDLDVSNNVRMVFTLNSDIADGTVVNITAIKTLIKK